MVNCARPVNLNGPEQRVKWILSIVTWLWTPVNSIKYEKIEGLVSGKLPHVKITLPVVAGRITTLYAIEMFAVGKLYRPPSNANSTQSWVSTPLCLESMLYSVVHPWTVPLPSSDQTHVVFEEIRILDEQLVCVRTVTNSECRRMRLVTRRKPIFFQACIGENIHESLKTYSWISLVIHSNCAPPPFPTSIRHRYLHESTIWLKPSHITFCMSQYEQMQKYCSCMQAACAFRA